MNGMSDEQFKTSHGLTRLEGHFLQTNQNNSVYVTSFVMDTVPGYCNKSQD